RLVEGVEMEAPGGAQRQREGEGECAGQVHGASEHQRDGGSFSEKVAASAEVAGGAEPPLGADADKVIDRAPGVEIVGGVERARAGVADGEEVNEADVRALEGAAAARADEGDEAEAAHLGEHWGEDAGIFLDQYAALLGLIGGLERDAGDLGEPHLGAHDDDALVEVVPVERAAGVAELTIIGAEQEAEGAALPVAAEGDQKLVGA